MPKTITISDETYESIKDQLNADEQIDCYEDFVGKQLFIRTVTYHMVGKCEKIIGNLMQMSSASWIADSGRFAQAVATGSFSEIEPVGKCWVNMNSIVDMFPANYKLPTEQK